jgi:hypothetical protein
MITELTSIQARDIILADKYSDWSYNAAIALVEYFECREADDGESIVLDMIEINGQYAEYSSLMEWAEQYYRNNNLASEFEWEEDTDDDDKDEDIRNDIMEKTTLIEFDGGIIVEAFGC